MSSFTATIDANVLFHASVRDTLLRAHSAGLFRAQWTPDILAEVERNPIPHLAERGLDRPEAKVQRLMTTLRTVFPEAMVMGYEGLIPSMQNNKDDRHVLAAAVRGGAEVIVTYNLKDFPASALDPYGVEAQGPDEFLSNLFDLYPDGMRALLHEQVVQLRNPPITFMELLEELEETLPEFVRMVRDHASRTMEY
jgi:predicted nucleic acid-binding protein